MVRHACRVHDPVCWRCQLNEDELGIADAGDWDQWSDWCDAMMRADDAEHDPLD